MCLIRACKKYKGKCTEKDHEEKTRELKVRENGSMIISLTDFKRKLVLKAMNVSMNGD